MTEIRASSVDDGGFSIAANILACLAGTALKHVIDLFNRSKAFRYISSLHPQPLSINLK